MSTQHRKFDDWYGTVVEVKVQNRTHTVLVETELLVQKVIKNFIGDLECASVLQLEILKFYGRYNGILYKGVLVTRPGGFNHANLRTVCTQEAWKCYLKVLAISNSCTMLNESIRKDLMVAVFRHFKTKKRSFARKNFDVRVLYVPNGYDGCFDCSGYSGIWRKNLDNCKLNVMERVMRMDMTDAWKMKQVNNVIDAKDMTILEQIPDILCDSAYEMVFRDHKR